MEGRPNIVLRLIVQLNWGVQNKFSSALPNSSLWIARSLQIPSNLKVEVLRLSELSTSSQILIAQLIE